MFGDKEEMRSSIRQLRQEVNELHDAVKNFNEAIMKLKHPAKYKVGDTLKGGIVYEVKFDFHPKCSVWIYRIVKGDTTENIYQEIK